MLGRDCIGEDGENVGWTAWSVGAPSTNDLVSLGRTNSYELRKASEEPELTVGHGLWPIPTYADRALDEV